MKFHLWFFILAWVLLSGPCFSDATIINFEDISTQLEFEMPEFYSGLSWDNFHIRKDTYLPESGFNAYTASGSYIAYNSYGNPTAVSDALFDFKEAYFAAAWTDYLKITAIGYLNGVEKYNETIFAKRGELTRNTFNFLGITSLLFHSSVYEGTDSRNHFILDDFDFELVPPADDQETILTPTPEPSTIFLMIFGIVALIGGKYLLQVSGKNTAKHD